MTHFTEQKTKISITHHGDKFKAELAWDANLENVFDAFMGLLNAAGFHPDSIKDMIVELGEEYKKEQE